MPHGPSCHQSNADMINWCRGDFKRAAVSSLSVRLFEFGVSITFESNAEAMLLLSDGFSHSSIQRIDLATYGVF